MSVNCMSSDEDFNKVKDKMPEISTTKKNLFLTLIFP